MAEYNFPSLFDLCYRNDDGDYVPYKHVFYHLNVGFFIRNPIALRRDSSGDYGHDTLINESILPDKESGKWKFMRHKDENWRERESNRMSQYAKLPDSWIEAGLEPIPDHYAHVSMTGNLIAYTESETKGQLDLQTVTKPGRYLQKYYPHLTGDQIRELGNMVGAEPTLKFATSTEDIVAVYLNGPTSCMSHSLDDYDSDIHPVSVYGESDLQLAYLGSIKTRVSGRALVNPANKKYVRIYGDHDRMQRALSAIGYSQTSNAFLGAKVRKIYEKTGYVLPYFDGNYNGVESIFDDKGQMDPNFWRICDSNTAEYFGNQTDGIAEENSPSYTCECCENSFSEESDIDTVYTRNGNTAEWCNRCAQRHGFVCEGSGETYDSSFYTQVEIDGHIYESEYADDRGYFTCAGTDESYWLHDNECIELYEDGFIYSLEYAEENFYKWEDGTWHDQEEKVDSNEQLDIGDNHYQRWLLRINLGLAERIKGTQTFLYDHDYHRCAYEEYNRKRILEGTTIAINSESPDFLLLSQLMDSLYTAE